MPRISTIRPDIVSAVSSAGTWLTLDEIVGALAGKYSRVQVYDAIKWLVIAGDLQPEKETAPGGRARSNRYLAPTKLKPSADVGFDSHTVSLSRRLSIDLTGPLGWQLQVQRGLCRTGGTSQTAR